MSVRLGGKQSKLAILLVCACLMPLSPSSAFAQQGPVRSLQEIRHAGVVIFFVSLLQRFGGAHDAAFWVALLAYLVISVGAYIGGHVVFKYGYMVNRNAFAKGKRAKEFTPIMAAADLADATPTKASLGATALVVVRRGDVVYALKETCSHAGGPLSEGELRGDTIICPWHASAFRLSDGAVRHGPASTRQVAYRARINDGQVEVQGPIE